ncbi:hypothetical protein FH972_026563 [Carpinus fangiana]|uniref:Uncharacterized protein n=1 Tax=Carpinus fangiana TaxID=176857 RepID=A0A5N6L5B4_9ROSI|nr:hypothetical protein FH972_026563 [Carpinus fangiana]
MAPLSTSRSGNSSPAGQRYAGACQTTTQYLTPYSKRTYSAASLCLRCPLDHFMVWRPTSEVVEISYRLLHHSVTLDFFLKEVGSDGFVVSLDLLQREH